MFDSKEVPLNAWTSPRLDCEEGEITAIRGWSEASLCVEQTCCVFRALLLADRRVMVHPVSSRPLQLQTQTPLIQGAYHTLQHTHTHVIITSACWHGNRNHLAGSLTYDVIRRAECDWTGDEWLLSWEGWWAGVYLKHRDRAMVSLTARQAETNPRRSDVSALSVTVQHITGRPLHTQANESWGAQILSVSF